MKRTALFLCLLLCLNSFGQNQINKTVTIPFTLLGSGHILIKAKINDIEGNFIFDTGAGLNLLTKKFADNIKDLKKTDGFYTGHRATGEQIVADFWDTKSFEMGNQKLNAEKFTIIDMDFPVDGLISLLPFRNIPITIDYKNKALILETEKSVKELAKKGISLPIQVSDELGKALDIATYVKLNDKLVVQMNLDSGAGFNVFRFNSRYMESLGIDPSKTEMKHQKSDFKPTEGNNYYYTNLSKINAQSNTKISASDFKATFIEGLIYEAIGSINWLGDKITIDIQNRNMIINN